jgi:DNA repair exonuclease SbcCD ATPase subunit
MTGDEEDWEQKQKVAEHRVIEEDYEKYLGVQEWFRREIQKVVDSTWIAELKKPRSGYAGVTIKRFFQHLRSNVAKLTNKEKKEMRKKIEFEWDQTMDIKEYFDKLDREAVKLDRWEIDVQPSDLVVAGVDQMQDSGIFDHKFLRTWEMKPENEKTWQSMKDYFIPEYRSIKTYEGSNRDVLEKMQNVQEGKKSDEVEVSDFFEEFRRDAMVGREQIQQVSTVAQGAADALKEITARLSEAMATIKTQQTTISTLTNTNKQLADTIAEMKKGGGGGGRGNTNANKNRDRQKKVDDDGDVQFAKCPICEQVHRAPAKKYCYELECNAHLRPENWVSRVKK